MPDYQQRSPPVSGDRCHSKYVPDRCPDRKALRSETGAGVPTGSGPASLIGDRHFLVDETVYLEKFVVVRGHPVDRVDVVASSLAPVDRVAG